MLVSEIKSRFMTEYDEYQSDYISNPRLTNIFWHASANVFDNNLIPQYQGTKRVTEDLLPLKKVQILSGLSSNEINLTQLVADYSSFISAVPTYVSSGVTYTWPATELLDSDINSYYAQGSLRYPKYKQYTNASSEDILYLMPTDTPNSIEVTFFRTFYPINFDNPSDDIPYTPNAISLLLGEAKKIAAQAFRDPEFFNTSNTMVQQDQSAIL